jgi:Protein of unknown function (DUF1236)
MQNRNRILVAGALFGTLALFSSANAEGDAGLDEADMDRFQGYVAKMNRPSHTYTGNLAVGAELPAEGMTYYELPAEYRVSPHIRYTVVNGRPVVVDTRTRRVMQMR